MADWNLPNTTAYAISSYSVGLTANASANVKGAYTEFFASTEKTGYLSITFTGASLNYAYLTDIAIGAAGSETVIVSNLLYEWSSSYGIGFGPLVIPILIPAGTRVSARTQCSTATSKILIVAINLIYDKPNTYGIVETYGANTADSGGTSIDPGATAYTWGAWYEFSASCPRNIKGIIIGTTGGLDQSRSDAYHYLHVGIGPAGSEIVIAMLSMRSHSTTNYVTPTFSEFFPVSIPSGTRISVRSYCTINTAGNRLVDAILYTFS